MAAALLIVPQVEFNFEVILYITILVFVSPGSCFKSAIRFQSRQIVMLFKAVKGGKNYSPEKFERTLHCLIGNLRDPVTWYGINYTGTQMTQWDFQNKGEPGWTGTSSFVL